MSILKSLIKKFFDEPRSPPVPEEHFNRLEFYKENYYKEIERRNSLTNEVALQGTVMIALISGIFYLLTSFTTSIPYSSEIFKLSVFVNLVLITVTGYHLFDSYYKFTKKGRKNVYLPELKDIDKYYDDCKGFSDQPLFENYLKETFIEMCDALFLNNNDKSLGLTRASKWMTRSFACAGVVVFVFFLNFTANPYYIQYQKNRQKYERSTRTTKPKPVNNSRATSPNSTTADSIERKKSVNRDTNKTGTGDYLHKGRVKPTK